MTFLGRFAGKVAVVTGAAQGIGRDVALRLAAAFRNTTAEFWLTMQERYDLALARQRFSVANVRVFWEPAHV